MRERTVREEYFKWLYSNINNEKGSFKKLCEILHNKPFEWSVDNDKNRYQDGWDLKQTFVDENRLDETHTEVAYFLKGGCSVLEMLIGVAQRLDYQTINLDDPGVKTAYWFRILLRNLNLFDYDDSWRFTPISEGTINNILDVMINRTYDFNGNGSLFPMKRKPPKDMKTVEIWYQLMLWLDENYGLG